MSGLNIAFVNAEDPGLARTGYLLLTQQIIETLRRENRVQVIVLNGAELGRQGTDTHVLHRRPKDGGKRIGQALSAFSRQSMVVHQTRFSGCREQLVGALADIQPDVVIFNHIRSAWLAPAVKHLGKKIVYIAHNAEASTAQSVADMQPVGITRIMLQREAKKVERLEANILRVADHVVALTNEDAGRLRYFAPRTPVSVIPPAVEIQSLDAGEIKNEILLLGSFRWLPKRLNAIWLAEQVMPRVRRQKPDAYLRIVGTEAGRLQSALQHLTGVTIYENVPSVREFYAQAAVVAVPEKQAGGIKLKTLEAASFGKAIVTTTAGREGTGLLHGTNCLVADGVEEFAGRILAFLDHVPLRQRCGIAAQNHVAGHFSHAAIAQSYATMLRKVANDSAQQIQLSQEKHSLFVAGGSHANTHA